MAATTAGTLPEDRFDQQPLVAEDVVFICRARLDNRAELAVALGIAQQAAQSAADSQILCAAYHRWGEECVQRLVGDFAFVAWHPRAARLVGAVDHGGAARLYWAPIRNGIVLAGELAALLTHSEVSNVPDYSALARMLDAGMDRSRTAFLAVRAVPGGHRIRWERGLVSVDRWWNPATHPIARRDPGEYAACTRELLERAVQAQCRATAGISATLSGGLDSGLVTALAARHLARRGTGITAYTAVPEPGLPCGTRRHWEADDAPYAREVASLYANVRHETIPPSGRCSIDLMPALFDTEKIPMKSVSNLIWMDAISRSGVAAGAAVILSGRAGNATLSWSGAGGISELLRRRAPMAALLHGRRVANADGRSLWRLLASCAKQRALRHRARQARPSCLLFVHRHWWPSIESRQGAFAKFHDAREAWLAFAQTPKSIWSPDLLAQTGADWRDPTSDRRLVETLLTFPLSAFALAGLPRGLARHVARGILPEQVRLRRTRGAQVPEIAALIKRGSANYFDAIDAMDKCGTCCELLDIPRLRMGLRRIVAGDLDQEAAGGFDRAFGVGHFLLSLAKATC